MPFETPEEYVQNRIKDINQKKGYLFAQIHPEFPLVDKKRSVEAIEKLCGNLELELPKVKTLIKKIYPHIISITEQTKVAAIYLLLGRAYSNLESSLFLCGKGKNIEAMELSRSGKEALDLVMLFWEDENDALLKKWYKGKIIGNAEAREFLHKYLNNGLREEFKDTEQPIDKMLKISYQVMSSYTHSGYAGLLDSVDVFRFDYDFENQAGFHYCVDNFHIIEDLYKKILLQLKNSFLHLKDFSALDEAKLLYKPFESEYSEEQMLNAFDRHR
jgi:hypothetical protein